MKRKSKQFKKLLADLHYYQTMNRVDERSLRSGRQKVKELAKALREENNRHGK